VADQTISCPPTSQGLHVAIDLAKPHSLTHTGCECDIVVCINLLNMYFSWNPLKKLFMILTTVALVQMVVYLKRRCPGFAESAIGYALTLAHHCFGYVALLVQENLP
jgi:hypothetical protein